jgi:hypothetical protein
MGRAAILGVVGLLLVIALIAIMLRTLSKTTALTQALEDQKTANRETQRMLERIAIALETRPK